MAPERPVPSPGVENSIKTMADSIIQTPSPRFCAEKARRNGSCPEWDKTTGLLPVGKRGERSNEPTAAGHFIREAMGLEE